MFGHEYPHSYDWPKYRFIHTRRTRVSTLGPLYVNSVRKPIYHSKYETAKMFMQMQLADERPFTSTNIDREHLLQV